MADDELDDPPRPTPADPLAPERRVAAAVLERAWRDARTPDRRGQAARAFLTSPARLGLWSDLLDVPAETLAERARKALEG